MKKCKVHNIIILYGINFILIGFIILSNTGIILDNNRVILKSMDDSTEVTNLNNTINTLEASHTEYATKIQTHKTNLATAITNAGVTTSSNATFETMITNISNIISNKTSDATATAAQILKGQTAWVGGNKITGSMTDRGAWTSTPTTSTKVTIPAGYHNGSGYVDTSSVYNAGYARRAPVYLGAVGGNGTISATSISNFRNLTNSNFILIPISLSGSSVAGSDGNGLFTINPSLSYNPSSGIITISGCLYEKRRTSDNYCVLSAMLSVQVYYLP